MAVVKADAYGHGAVRASRAFLEAGATCLGVSSVAEGAELRAAGIDAPVVVLGGAFPGEAPRVVELGFACAVYSAAQAEALSAAATAVGRTASVHVKVNTGMTRLGLDVGEVEAFGGLLGRLRGLSVDGLFSHFATADAVELAAARVQVDRFRAAQAALTAAGHRPAHVHLANSAAVLATPDAHFTLVRPGIMLYGYAPAAHLAARAGVTPAMRFGTRVAQVRSIAAGTSVGYGWTWTAARPSRIAVVPVGYADGYHRLNSNRAHMLVRGRRVPLAGRVCMDHAMLDVTDVAGVEAGEPVVMFGSSGAAALGADEVAAWCESISYEMLTSVGKRVPRRHVEEFGDV
jgi:alanine racemase